MPGLFPSDLLFPSDSLFPSAMSSDTLPTESVPTIWRGLRTLNIGVYPRTTWSSPMSDPNLRGHVERKR